MFVVVFLSLSLYIYIYIYTYIYHFYVCLDANMFLSFVIVYRFLSWRRRDPGVGPHLGGGGRLRPARRVRGRRRGLEGLSIFICYIC